MPPKPRQPDAGDPERWALLLRLYQVEELSQQQIADLLSVDEDLTISQPTVNLAIADARNRRPLTDGVRAALDYYKWCSEKDSVPGRVSALIGAVSAGARRVREAQTELVRNRVIAVMDRVSAVPRAIREEWGRREARKAQVREAFAPLYQRGMLEVRKNESEEFFGDAALLLETDGPIFYESLGALLVAGAPDDYRFPCGLTAAELREGVTMEQRMRGYAVSEGSPRPHWIGVRRANFITAVAYPDEPWFFGGAATAVHSWREMREGTHCWMIERKLPTLPGAYDDFHYERRLEIELELLRDGFDFEDSTLGWGADWEAEVAEKENEVRRLARRRSAFVSLQYGAVGVAVLIMAWLVVPPTFGLTVSVVSVVAGWPGAITDGTAGLPGAAKDSAASWWHRLEEEDRLAQATAEAVPTASPPEPILKETGAAAAAHNGGGIWEAVTYTMGRLGAGVNFLLATTFAVLPQRRSDWPRATLRYLMVPVAAVSLATYLIWAFATAVW